MRTGLLPSGEAGPSRRSRRTHTITSVRAHPGALIEVLLVTGHLCEHPVGLTALYRLVDLDPTRFRVTVAALT